jgi:K+-sensing histidine kinase KdpD
MWEIWPTQPAWADSTPRYLVRPESSVAKALWLQVEVLPSPDSTETEYVVRLHDVTAQITQRHEMHGFHNVIAHKLGTPLSGISVSLQLLKLAAQGCADADIQEQVEIAWDSYQRLADDFAKIRQYLNVSEYVSTDEGFPLSHFLASVARVSSDLTLKHISVTLPEAIQNQVLRFSSWALDVLLWETLENAQKYHPQHSPSVEISVAAANANHIRIQIADDGLTLPTEQLAQVWTPYYQGEKYFTGEVPGMGLGLSVIATLVWSVGGECRLYNREAMPGVVVEVLIPVLDWVED